MRRRHPTPGYTSTLQLMTDHLDVPYRMTPDGVDVDGTKEDIDRAARKLGLRWVDSVHYPGRVRACCVICGEGPPGEQAPVCDPVRHRAYYDALEAQESSDVHVSD